MSSPTMGWPELQQRLLEPERLSPVGADRAAEVHVVDLRPMDFDAYFRDLAPRYLGRPWRAADGLHPTAVDSVEGALRCSLPAAMRAFYCSAGASEALCAAHNRVRAPAELAFEDDYLLFMDENQDVVSWGVRRAEIDKPDPPVWQRNNTPPAEWFPEERSFVELLESMFDWYVELGVLGVKE